MGDPDRHLLGEPAELRRPAGGAVQALPRPGGGGRREDSADSDRRGRASPNVGKSLAGQPHARRGARDGLRHRGHDARRHRHARSTATDERFVIIDTAGIRASAPSSISRSSASSVVRVAGGHRPLRRGASAHRRHAGRDRAGQQDRRLHRRAGQGGRHRASTSGTRSKRTPARWMSTSRKIREKLKFMAYAPGALHLRADRPADARRVHGDGALGLRSGHAGASPLACSTTSSPTRRPRFSPRPPRAAGSRSTTPRSRAIKPPDVRVLRQRREADALLLRALPARTSSARAFGFEGTPLRFILRERKTDDQ